VALPCVLGQAEVLHAPDRLELVADKTLTPNPAPRQ
jgi:hypothetical protein